MERLLRRVQQTVAKGCRMDLIPLPRNAALREDAAPYAFGPEPVLDAGPGTGGTARWLRRELGAATGWGLPQARPEAAGDADIRLRLDPRLGADLGPEGYRIGVDGSGVELAGASAAGLFWAAQTLRQLLGADAHRKAPLPGRVWSLPHGSVEDGPRFGWRGMMLDVARHFMPKDGVLRYIDLLAAHKLNVLHLHLTDDQGWRIEIKRHPRLTEVGAWRPRSRWGHRASPLWNETPHGGFYAQDDIREIVAYAAERHVRVVPEIDVPGHSQAAIAAYPELGNADVVDTAALGGCGTTGASARTCSRRPRTYCGSTRECSRSCWSCSPSRSRRSCTWAGTSAPRRSGAPRRRRRSGSGTWGWPARTGCSPGSSGTSTPGWRRAGAG
ncbi:hypothetical protein GCM10020254_52260 [Streptomyces goshikiensis]